MRPFKFVYRTLIKQPKDAVYDWHLRRASFSRSFPSWEAVKIQSEEELPGKQCRVVLTSKGFFFPVRRVFRIQYPRNREVISVKLEVGPIKLLDFHTEVRTNGDNSSEILERVEYLLRFPNFLGSFRRKRFEKRLSRLFAYKHEVIAKDLSFFPKAPPIKPLKILVSGSNGLIGSALVDLLRVVGHDVSCLVRGEKESENKKEIVYNPISGEVDRSKLEDFDAVVHLWGKSIQGRWTKKTKEEMLKSRLETTRRLAKVFASLQSPPKVFLSASAVGYYGDTDAKGVDESEKSGNNSFLAEVCRGWEQASSFLTSHNIRIVHLRFGVVLSSKKGALKEMLLPFKLGLGSILGSGEQYMSWIAIDDAVSAIYHAILTESLSGPINIVSPTPITNKEFSTKLAKYLHRPLALKISKPLLRLFKGQMGEELLLTSVHVLPKKLLASGFRFRYPTLDEALPHLIY